MRIAAVGDLHAREGDATRVASLFEGVAREADLLVLAGDLTDHGREGEAEALVRGLRGVGVPVLAVLGNHDHEAGDPREIVRMLRGAGVDVLDREHPTLVRGEVGFAGVKGFGGGFGKRLVRGFGEEPLKAFVSASVVEAEALRAGLASLATPSKVALLHYAPIAATLEGEPPEIWPFLGTARLEEAADAGGATLVLHGHAHHGRPRGATAGGAPVFNVSAPVLRASGSRTPYALLDA